MSEGTVDIKSGKITKVKRILCIALFVAGFFSSKIIAQDSDSATVNAFPADSISKWSFYAEGAYYILPKDQNIFMLVTSADRNMLHLEMRYNYEERNTASIFGGLNFNFGNEFKLLLTPMAGLVFGRLNGIAPGLETVMDYKIFEFSAESEYYIDFEENENNFGYAYLQLGATLMKNITFGMTAQRTQLYKTNRDLQRGVFAAYAFHTLDATFTWFNPFTKSYFFVTTLSTDFQIR